MFRFHVVTLNAWFVLAIINRNIVQFRLLPYPYPLGSRDRYYRLERLAEALKSSDFDVIALQEVRLSI